MLSVGNWDERKGIGLGFGVGGEMEETELEEGEACYYQEDHDESIDPDVHLSYIDEKLQHVLGHFQKDFEGGVSAENLGAKFGGYGSFLPTYQRSPSVWSHPRTPQKVQNSGSSVSPKILPLEGHSQNHTVPLCAPLSARDGPASSSSAALPVSRVPFGNNSVKQDVCMFSALGSAELSPKFEHVNKSNKPANQKTLKVRIKMGNENLSARKKAEIYSGLGLDTSPSLEDSPTESGGVSLESREDPDESPTSILQIMTSFTVPGGLILSPLPDSLLHLTEKCVKDGRVGAGCRGIQESSSTLLVNESTSMGGDAKGLGDEKMKVVEKGRRLVEWKNGNDKDAVNDFSAYLKKEINTENPASNGLSKASKISCPSNLECFVADTVKGTDSTFNISREANKVRVGESVESISGQEVVKFEKWNAKVDSTENIREYKKSSSRKDISVDSRKDVKCKVDKSYGPSKAAFYDFEDGKDMNGGPVDLPKQVGQKPMSYEPDGMKVPDEKEQPFSGCKRRSKGTQSNEISSVELPKKSLAIAFSAAQKDRKSIHESDCPSKSKRDGSELHKKFGKASERNGNSYGDIELELEESRTDWLQSPLKNTPKDSMLEAVEKETLAFADKLKDGSSGKEVNNMTSDSFPKSGPSIAPSTKNEPFSDAAPGGIDPVFIEENWVCCDRCQKWRLLPFGTNPNYLPKKWLCSMLNWLPGMNRCNVSEEETTKALYALYQIPVIDGQNNLQSHPHAAASGMTSAEVRHLDRNCQDPSFHALPSGGKKKHGSKEILNGTSHSCPTHSLNPTKKIQQVSLKSKSTNGVNQSPSEYSLMNGSHFQHLSKSSDLTEETSRHKQKEKKKLLECHSDGGDAEHLKKKNKRDADREGSRASKNVRAEGLSYAHEDWNFDHSGPIERVCSRSSGGLPAKATGNDLQKYNDRSHKISNSDAKGNVIVSVKRLKDGSMVSLEGCSEDIGTYDKRDSSAKKRKPKEWQDNRIYPEIFLGTENHLQHAQKETNENMRRKEKKARVSKTECKEASTSRGSVRTDKKGRVTQIIMSGGGDVEEGKSFGKDRQQGQNEANNVTQGTVESIDLLKRDLGYGQSSMAATSSSSKVSGSRKTKTNFHELKGSPVESVSSSPLRICNPEKLTSTKRNVLEKDDGRNADFSIMSSPRRCSDGEGDRGGNLSGTGKKEIASSIALRESLESSIFDYLDGDAKNMPDAEAGAQTQPSSFEFEDTHLLNGDSDIVEQHYPNPNELASKNHCHNPDRVNYNHYHCNVSLPTKLGRGSISLFKEKHKSSNSNLDRGKFKASDLLSDQEELYLSDRLRYEAEFESHDLEPCKEEMGDGKHFCQDEVGVPDKDKNYAGKKDISGKWSSETSKRENQSKLLGNGSLDVKPSFICGKDGKSNPQSQDGEDERSSNRFLSDRTQRSERMELASGRGKPKSFPLLGGDKQEKLSQCPQALPTSHKGGGSDVLPVNTSNGDALKASKQRRKPGNQNGANISLRYHATHNGQGVKDVDTLHTVRKDSSQAAANVFLKEAADLKHMADRLKNSGSDLESIGLYFEAALQFLHGASLLEPCNIESAKHGEITQSMHVYSSTAKLCEFCARGYERCQHMAAAALAYKCMEVAYLRVTYSKHFIASRDRNELQRTLQMVPPGESPSSSASDVDNLNNQATLNRSNVVRLLNFAQDVGFAMEASEKSMNAFAAANRRLGGAQFEDGISSVKRVLDLNFQDVEGFLRLVRLAMEAIGR